ncbi:MAG: lactate utilization protein [Candidatus Odinarchaeota archaeon]|nr:lactate utilization protein [Candidatus Odinarchaeota archaeon]
MAVRGHSDVGPIADKTTHSGLGSKEMHVILLDNDRSKAIKEGFSEVLRCIRCLTCDNYCPVYTVTSPRTGYGYKKPGFNYGGYIGGHGIILAAFVYGMEKAIEVCLFACAMCGNCYQHCPMKINAPEMISKLRKEVIERSS